MQSESSIDIVVKAALIKLSLPYQKDISLLLPLMWLINHDDQHYWKLLKDFFKKKKVTVAYLLFGLVIIILY